MAVNLLQKKKIFKIFLFASVFYSLNSWTTPPISLADQQPPPILVTRSTTSPFSLEVVHQGMVSQIQISLDYGQRAKGHILLDETLVDEVARLLISYPEEYDYWEIVNLTITQRLLETYPQLEYVTLKLDIIPRDRIHYYRRSTVTRWVHGDVHESWRFEVQELPIQGRTLNAAINYSYKTDAAMYPDYLDICHQLTEYLSISSPEDMPLEQLEQTLAQHLLHHYSEAIADIAIRFE